MKMMTTKSALVCCLLVVVTEFLSVQPAPTPPPATPAAALVTSSAGSRIQFQTPVYDFGKIKSGEPVKYTFIFTNIGDAVLILTNVQAQCGCTTAGEWSHKVDPGKTGTISVQFNSANYSGQVIKTVMVTNNDKSHPTVTLQLKGTIWKPIDVQPTFAVLTIPADTQSNVTTTVHIVNNMDEPLILSAPESNNKAFTAELRTNTSGKDFQLAISTAPPFEQTNLQGQITLKTSSTNMPVISVTAWANVQPAVVVQPLQIILPAGPLPAKQTVSIAIQNNGVNSLRLSEPSIDSKGVELHLAETDPGRLFTASLTFPEGFELTQGKRSEFSVKSSFPRQPVIKVAITQTPKPVVVSAAPNPSIVPSSAAIPRTPPSPALR